MKKTSHVVTGLNCGSILAEFGSEYNDNFFLVLQKIYDVAKSREKEGVLMVEIDLKYDKNSYIKSV